MNEYEVKTKKLTPKMMDEIRKQVDWLKADYKEHNEKVGKPKTEYEFVDYEVPKCQTKADGSKTYSRAFGVERTFSELVITITFPLKYLPFKASDVHTYRWNEKRQELEHESTEIS